MRKIFSLKGEKNSTMIYACLRDGLGNQMFIYAYARALQERNNQKTLVLDTFDFRKDIRTYSLNNFRLNPCVKKNKIMSQILNRVILTLKLGKERSARIENEKFIKNAKKGIYSDFFSYSVPPFVDSNKKRIIVRGFYQSHKNFENIKNLIKEELTVVTPPSNENKNMLEQISQDNAVCVHVRRGDYVNNPAWSKELAICTEEYYKKAMDIVASKVENPVFYIFSNCSEDIEWIKQNYKFDYELKYVDLNNPDYEELRLMYNCKHFIISNSTFSWWAQYLSQNENRVVVAPSLWNRLMDASNIYMDDWDIVEVE